MRVGAVLALVAATAVLVAQPAQAGVRVDYFQAFTTSVPGQSTGMNTQLLYKNPSDPSAKPIPVRQEVFTFPAGTTFAESVVPDCTASDVDLMLLGPSACPADSWIGSGDGDTTMTGFDNTEQAMDLNAWDDGGTTVLLGGSHDIQPIRFVTRAPRNGETVTVDVPRTPGGPPDGESALRRVHHLFAARTAPDGRAYTRTPAVCPASGVWTFTAAFTFADGVTEHDSYDMPCTATP